MIDKELRFRRARTVYYVLGSVMALAVLAVIAGVIIFFFAHRIGASLIVYGLVVAFVVLSFYFISRTRYTKAKLAFQAIQMAKSNTGNSTVK